MTVPGALRAVAFAIAAVGLIGPTWNTGRLAPLPVKLEIDLGRSTSAERLEAAEDVRRRLAAAVDGDISFDSPDDPVARVVIGKPASAPERTGNVPVSIVSIEATNAPNLRVVAAVNPSPIRVGWRGFVAAAVEAQGLTGRTYHVILERHGVEIARAEHTWTRDRERFDLELPVTPAVEGISRVTVRVLPMDGESTDSDNAADLRLVATARRVKVLAYEPRPSWTAAFVRRALEDDPAFDVSAVTRASRDQEVRAGDPPSSVTAEALNPYDVVLVGAPEELRTSEIDALRQFARRRGGAVVFLPDRRPSGRYLDLAAVGELEERLLDAAAELRSVDGVALRASELAVVRRPRPGAEILATMGEGQAARSVVISSPAGSGRVVLSGALDAWRFRASPDQGFSRFWRARIEELGQTAPSRIALELEPAIARPGDRIELRARVNRTEFDAEANPVRMPSIAARLVDAKGAQLPIRLWPTSEVGVFEGRFMAPSAGRYDAQVATASGASANDVLLVADDVRYADGGVENHEVEDLVARATGGVAVSAGDLAPLERHLRSLPRARQTTTVRPARSPWLLMLFAAVLGAEWTIRRRRGLR